MQGKLKAKRAKWKTRKYTDFDIISRGTEAHLQRINDEERESRGRQWAAWRRHKRKEGFRVKKRSWT